MGVHGANDLGVSVDVWESMKYPVTQAQLEALPQTGVVTERQYDTYPYAKDIHPTMNWNAVFHGDGTTKIFQEGTKRDLGFRMMRRLHNLIKATVIEYGTRPVEQHVPMDIFLRSLGGMMDHNGEWTLPSSTSHTLEAVLGLTNIHLDDANKVVLTNQEIARHPADIKRPSGPVTVVDLCCGRGGDLNKYEKTLLSRER